MCLKLCFFVALLAQTEPVLPPGLEQPALDLLGSYGRNEPLASGWTLGDARIQPERIIYDFHRGGDLIRLVLEYPDERHAVRTRHFGVRLEDPGGVLSREDARDLLNHLAGRIRDRDGEWSPWLEISLPPCAPVSHESIQKDSGSEIQEATRESIMWGQPTQEQFESHLPVHPTALCQSFLLLALVALAARFRTLLGLIRKVPRGDWFWLLGAVAVGTVLRLLGGVRIPGVINTHGFDLVQSLLYGPPQGYDFHLNGIYALGGLFLAVLPRCELTLVGVQFVFSILTIPAVYALCRLWIGPGGPARWAACIAAVLPVFVFYATTEIRPVAGVFFLVATLTVLGMAVRDPHPLTMLAAAFLGGFTAQMHPFLLMTPLVALLMVLSNPGGRRLLSMKWTWVASGIFLLLWLEPALLVLSFLLLGDQGPATMVLPGLSGIHTVFLPGGGGENASLPGNVLLHPYFTPPPLVLLVVAGILSAFRRSEVRMTLMVVFFFGLFFTETGLFIGRMNLARLQFFAQPFYCLLAACGLAWVLGAIRGDGFRPGWARGAAGLVLICVSLIVWPGPIGSVFTPQMERRVIREGLEYLDDGQVVIWPMSLKGTMISLPTYLSREKGLDLKWGGLMVMRVPELLFDQALIYYRPAACYDLENQTGEPVKTIEGELLRRECARVESRLELQPLYVRSVPARPDCTQEYGQDTLRIGFFRCRGGAD